MDKSGWRHSVLAVITLGPLALLPSLAAIPQDPSYHLFADTRTMMGIPNFFDVVSNLPFLLVGLSGVRFCLKNAVDPARTAWTVLFFGVGAVSIGSAYYHWQPGNASLVLDRLPMTIGFMGLFVALLSEYVNSRLASILLIPAVIIGLGSVLYWHVSDDLRLYAWVQIMPLLSLPVIMLLFRSAYTHQRLLLVALACYVLAKLAETYDLVIFDGLQGAMSGHTIKHLFAAAGGYAILQMLRKREPRLE